MGHKLTLPWRWCATEETALRACMNIIHCSDNHGWKTSTNHFTLPYGQSSTCCGKRRPSTNKRLHNTWRTHQLRMQVRQTGEKHSVSLSSDSTGRIANQHGLQQPDSTGLLRRIKLGDRHPNGTSNRRDRDRPSWTVPAIGQYSNF